MFDLNTKYIKYPSFKSHTIIEFHGMKGGEKHVFSGDRNQNVTVHDCITSLYSDNGNRNH